jgi:hypothetical protein
LAEREKKKGMIYDIKLWQGEKLYAKEVREKKKRDGEKAESSLLQNAPSSSQSVGGVILERVNH